MRSHRHSTSLHCSNISAQTAPCSASSPQRRSFPSSALSFTLKAAGENIWVPGGSHSITVSKNFRAVYLHVLNTMVLTMTAFNAALVIFASSLIYQHPGPALPLLPPAVGQARKSLDEAATALEALDRGNKLVEKCTAYLKKLSRVLDVLSTPTSAPAVLDKSSDPARQVASAGSTYQPLSDQQIRSALRMPEQSQSDSGALGMDLGEFMSMDDMAFLDSYTFPFEQAGPGTDFFGA